MKKLQFILLFTIFFCFQMSIAQNQFENLWWMEAKSDTLPATSLLKAKSLLHSNQNTTTPVIIAVLDADVDIHHKDLKPFLWTNTKEIEGNNLDDDHNGYVDDVHGWNFLGKKEGDTSLHYTRMEATRILAKYSKEELDKLYAKKKVLYNYDRVKASYDTVSKKLKKDLGLYQKIDYSYSRIVDTLKAVTNYKSITLSNIDSITSKDPFIVQCVTYAKDMLNQGYPYEKIKSTLDYKVNGINVCMNLEYDNRELVGDDIYNFKDDNYGFPISGTLSSEIDHGTKVSGVIAATLQALNLKNNIKIMPLCITGIGDFTDKDLALAIRYAVDNGAKIITLSQTKTFSLDDKKVKKAMKYAAKHDVLIVKSAGNENLNLDKIVRYPNDTNKKNKVVLDNLLVVGASGKTMETLRDEDSNYGKNNVDIFAPGIDIKTLKPNNDYTYGSGSSYSAPIVSSIAGLILSLYPNLSASEVKDIILNSGDDYDLKFINPEAEDTEEKIRFESFSKSGKLVNGYKALLMAEKVAKRR